MNTAADIDTTPHQRFLETITHMEQNLTRAYKSIENHLPNLTPNLGATQILLLIRFPEAGCFLSDVRRVNAYFGGSTTYKLEELERKGYLKDKEGLLILTDKGRAVRTAFFKLDPVLLGT